MRLSLTTSQKIAIAIAVALVAIGVASVIFGMYVSTEQDTSHSDRPGSIVGVVTFAGTVPSVRVWKDDDSGHAACQVGATFTETPLEVDANGGLADVFVRLVGHPTTMAPPDEPVVVTLAGCAFDRRVVGFVAGQQVRFVSQDENAHVVQAYRGSESYVF